MTRIVGPHSKLPIDWDVSGMVHCGFYGLWILIVGPDLTGEWQWQAVHRYSEIITAQGSGLSPTVDAAKVAAQAWVDARQSGGTP